VIDFDRTRLPIVRYGWKGRPECVSRLAAGGRSEWRRVMPTYRLYSFTPDRHGGEPPVTVECEDDEAAIERAKQLLDGQAIEIEIWQRDRLARSRPARLRSTVDR
jgi:hypothetical protein